MKIQATPEEFLGIVALYLLERLEERELEFQDGTSTEKIILSEESERVLAMLSRKGFGVELRRYKLKMPVLTRNKYNFIKKIFKGMAESEYNIGIKGKNDGQ